MDNLYPNLPGLERHQLDRQHAFYTGELPAELVFTEEQVISAWELQPAEYHTILMHGRPVKTPRKQQAYGADYHYTGGVNKALPIPELLRPFLTWAQEFVEPRLNGMLLNWYDGLLGHYIGPHHDSTTNMIWGAAIATLSLGEERPFRLTREEGRGKQKRVAETRDFLARHGSVFVMPYDTNLAWKHGVPHSARYRGRRISVTLRAFRQ